MHKHLIGNFLLVLFLLSFTLLKAQEGFLVSTTVFPKTLYPALTEIPETSEYAISFSKNGGPFQACQPYEDAYDVKLVGKMIITLAKYDEIRFRFDAPGYASVNRNVVILEKHLDDGVIPLGAISFKEKTIPEIDQVRYFIRRDGVSRLRVYLTNNTKGEFTVSRSSLRLELPVPIDIAGHNSGGGPDASFAISPDLSIISTCDEASGLETLIYEDGGADEFGLQSSGSLEFYPEKDRMDLVVDITSRIKILPREESFIDFLLPTSFNVSNIDDLRAYYETATNRNLKLNENGEKLAIDKISEFKLATIIFQFTDKQKTVIRHAYQPK